ncbi:MAG: hypothetical protein ABIR94_16235 [Rubrivivax sp.]
MKNPWTKKNPLMSMWLSAANSAIGSARGQATAAVKRETRKATTQATTAGMNQIVDFWANAWKPPVPKTPASTAARKRRKAR